MEFDNPYIQFVFNVVAITAITALWLTRALVRDAEEGEISTTGESLDRGVNQCKANMPHALPVRARALDSNPATHQDIREFVTHRSGGWIARSASARGVQS